MFSAVIKGTDTGAASVVARAHGFRTVRVHAELDDAVTLIIAGEAALALPLTALPDLGRLVQWYAEDLGRAAPFPSGALLYFRELSPDEIRRERDDERTRALADEWDRSALGRGAAG